jgi:hypothetical protein
MVVRQKWVFLNRPMPLLKKKSAFAGITCDGSVPGDTFETLSLFPSINVEDEGHWHGFISNGEVTGGGPCGSVS